MATCFQPSTISLANYQAARLRVEPDLAAKMFAVPDIIDDWLAPFGGFHGKRVLDFGCGLGEAAAGVAIGHDAADVHGVDIAPKFHGCAGVLERAFGALALPANLHFSRVSPGAGLGQGDYDVVMSWSAVEHVSRSTLETSLSAIHACLRPGGVAFIQISPLYFSPEGGHLKAVGYQAWEHLLRQTSEVLEDIRSFTGADEARAEKMSAMYLTLNRLTAAELIDLVSRIGFQMHRVQRDTAQRDPPKALLQSYSEDALMTEQIVLLLVRD